MRNVSSAFKSAVADGNRNYQCRAVITLLNSTVLELDNSNIMLGGLQYEDAVTSNNTFDALGSAIINSCTLIINNINEVYSSYNFEDANIAVYLGLDNIQEIKIGVYTVNEATYNESSITLYCLDNMVKFDIPYSMSTLTYPATLATILQDLCTICEVSGNTVFSHSDFVINDRPNDETLSCREVLSNIATVAGCFATCDSDGVLQLNKFDFSSLTSAWFDYVNSGIMNHENVHYINTLSSQQIATQDVSITGVTIIIKIADPESEESIKTYTRGTTGYSITVEENIFINETNVETIITWLANDFAELTFRPLSISHLDDLSIEAGDVAVVIDRNNNAYRTLVTNTNFSIGSYQSTQCSAESPSQKSSTRYSQEIKNYSAMKPLIDDAVGYAKTAYNAAQSAQQSAQSAQQSAQSAQDSADAASLQADAALLSANAANTAANSALDQLGIVQDVIGVLEWASEHGTFALTSDQTVQEDKVYFIYDSVTHDYTPVVNPIDSELSTYYELSVDEAMESYIMSHLSLTSRGLWILPSGISTDPTESEPEQNAPGYKVLISAGNATQNAGMYLYDSNGVLVTNYSNSSISFASDRQFYIGNNDAYILFTPASPGVNASISIGGANITLGDNRTLEEVVSNILTYDHSYVIDQQTHIATFTAYLYNAGVDVKTLYDPQYFTWYYKTEDNELPLPLNNNIVDGQHVNYGYRISVDIADMGYGGHIIGQFSLMSNSELLNEDDDTLTNSDDDTLTVRTPSGNSVRVSDLSVSTYLYDSDKIMIVGAEDEHLISIQTLQDYLNINLDKQVLFNTTTGWNTQTTLQSQPNTLYIYTDYQTDRYGNNIAGIKVGDGNAFVVDLPFTDAIATEHIADTTRHITQTERNFWNNKVRCYYAGTEQLVFTTS